MIQVTSIHPNGQWTLVLGINPQHLEGITYGQPMTLPIKQRDEGIIEPVLLVLMEKEAALGLGVHDLNEWVAQYFPDEHIYRILILSAEARYRLTQGEALRWDLNMLFPRRVPTGWNSLKEVLVVFGDCDEEMIGRLNGRQRFDLRQPDPLED